MNDGPRMASNDAAPGEVRRAAVEPASSEEGGCHVATIGGGTSGASLPMGLLGLALLAKRARGRTR
jgi:hypothetical protein